MLSIKDPIFATPGVFNRWSESAQATRLGTRKCPNYNLLGILSDIYSESYQELKYQAVIRVILGHITAPQNYTKISPIRRQVGISGFQRLYLPINEKLWNRMFLLCCWCYWNHCAKTTILTVNVKDKWEHKFLIIFIAIISEVTTVIKASSCWKCGRTWFRKELLVETKKKALFVKHKLIHVFNLRPLSARALTPMCNTVRRSFYCIFA